MSEYENLSLSQFNSLRAKLFEGWLEGLKEEENTAGPSGWTEPNR